MFIDAQGNLYVGDMLPGHREATAAEVTNWAASHTVTETLAAIADLEQQQIRETARMERERALSEAEAVALADFGLTPQALYAMGEGPNPPTAALTYRRLKDLDNQVKALRERL